MKSSIQDPWYPSSTGLGLDRLCCMDYVEKPQPGLPSSTARQITFTMLLLLPTDKTILLKSKNIISSLPTTLVEFLSQGRPSGPGAYSPSRWSSHQWTHIGLVWVGTTHPGPLLPVPAAGFFLSLPPPVAAVLELSAQSTVLGNSSCIWIP